MQFRQGRSVKGQRRPTGRGGRRHYLRPDPFRFLFQIIQIQGGGAGQAGQGIPHPGVIFGGQIGHQFLPHPVAGEPKQGIAAVLAKIPAQLLAIGRRIRLGYCQQGTKEGRRGQADRPGPGGNFGHPPQSRQPGPPQQMQQSRFRQVVGGMPYGHGGRAYPFRYRRQKGIAHFPRPLLKRGNAPFLLIGDGIPFFHGYRQAQLGGQGGDKMGVGVGFRAAKIVVQMGDMQAEAASRAEPAQAVEQGGGIGAAGYADHQGNPGVGVAGPPQGRRHLPIHCGHYRHNPTLIGAVSRRQMAGGIVVKQAPPPGAAVQ